MPQQYKIDRVNEIKVHFENNKEFIFNNFTGMTVAQMTNMRRELAKVGSKFVVVKNNFIKRIINEKGLPDMSSSLTGQTGVAFSKNDISEVLKILFKFSGSAKLVVKGGYTSESFFNADQLKALSKLPGKKQLLAILMATMNAPVTNFVYACNDVVTRFLRALNAVAETKK